eukprot:g44536.t1
METRHLTGIRLTYGQKYKNRQSLYPFLLASSFSGHHRSHEDFNMSSKTEVSDPLVGRQTGFERVLEMLTKSKLESVRPRMKDRTQTKWEGAITIQETDSLRTAFDLMNEHNILCLPVLGANNRVTGQLTMANLLQWVVEKFDVDPDFTTMGDFFAKKDLLDTTRVRSIYDDEDYQISQGRLSVYHAAEIMARHDAKRVIVTGWNDKVRGIFTQSMMIGELYNNLHLLTDEAKKIKVKNMSQSYYVSSIQDYSRTIDAFRYMKNWGRTALAVTNTSGAIVDELNERDLKAITASGESYMRLFSKVSEFKEYVRKDAESRGRKVPEVQLVTESQTLEEVIRIMDQTPCHRVFVVNTLKSKRPLHVISQTDVIRQVFPSLGWW